jgi:SAM-dependent methyltransferase
MQNNDLSKRLRKFIKNEHIYRLLTLKFPAFNKNPSNQLEKLYDDDVFTMIEPLAAKINNATYNTNKINYLKNIENEITPNTRILDFGGANGAISEALLNKYNLNSIDLVDVHDGTKLIPNNKIKYQCITNTLPYADNTFDITVAFMVLHHINPADRKKLINEIYRCTNKYVLIHEHDMQGKINLLLDIIHGMYMYVYKTDDYDKTKTFSEFKAWYMSVDELDELLKDKFTIIERKVTNNNTNSYITLLEKIHPQTNLYKYSVNQQESYVNNNSESECEFEFEYKLDTETEDDTSDKTTNTSDKTTNTSDKTINIIDKTTDENKADDDIETTDDIDNKVADDKVANDNVIKNNTNSIKKLIKSFKKNSANSVKLPKKNKKTNINKDNVKTIKIVKNGITKIVKKIV